jgi:hypothetical protein
MLLACLFALCFVYTSWRFYAFPRTNLLTRCHSASSCFLLFLCFRKVTHEIFSELDETKAEVPNYLTRRRTPKESRVALATPRSRHQGCDRLVHLLKSPFRLYIPLDGNSFLENILQAAAIIDTRSGGSKSSSRHPAEEGNHHRRPSSSPCLPLEWCVSSLPWTTGP